MKRFATFAGVGACAAALAASGPVLAQAAGEDYAPPRATAYAELAELPDWSGVWYPDWTLLFAGRGQPAVLTPAGQAQLDAYTERTADTGPDQSAQALCLPPGLPGMMQAPYPIEILYSPGRVTILTEAYQQVRRIYTDGRKLPEDPDLFFTGNSIGHWDDDTLVVETVGLNPQTSLTAGVKHTEQSRIDERIFLQAPGELIVEMTFTNPELLAEPYVARVAYRLDNEFPIREYICAENNRLTQGEDGANIDLGFDEEGDPFGPAPE